MSFTFCWHLNTTNHWFLSVLWILLTSKHHKAYTSQCAMHYFNFHQHYTPVERCIDKHLIKVYLSTLTYWVYRWRCALDKIRYLKVSSFPIWLKSHLSVVAPPLFLICRGVGDLKQTSITGHVWLVEMDRSMHYANKYNLYIWPINSWNRFPHINRCTDTTLHDQFVSDFMSCTYNDMINTATIHLDQSHVTRNGGLFQISHAATYQKKGGGQLLRDVILIRLENYWPSSTWFYRAHNAIHKVTDKLVM
jgi:hypothetical protein